uniref:Uncharacterized protein n=1 Tax=Anopheles maculatus TaxID=74869 RepID=A0A182S7R3_9DIPT
MSSPLDSPDILQSFVPISDIGATATSASSVKVPSLDGIHLKNQQVCSLGSLPLATYCHSNSNISNASFHNAATVVLSGMGMSGGRKHSSLSGRSNTVDSRSYRSLATVQDSISELPELILLQHGTKHSSGNDSVSRPVGINESDGSVGKTATDEINQNYLNNAAVGGVSKNRSSEDLHNNQPPGGTMPLSTRDRILNSFSRGSRDNMRSIVEFSLSSVGRSFIDNGDESDQDAHSMVLEEEYLPTPDTPPPNVSPSSSNKVSDSFSNDFKEMIIPPSATVSPIEANHRNKANDCSKYLLASGYGGSWDLLELDLDFHQVNCDPSFGNDVTETEFLGDDDDPFGMLPTQPTPPNLLDL